MKEGDLIKRLVITWCLICVLGEIGVMAFLRVILEQLMDEAKLASTTMTVGLQQPAAMFNKFVASNKHYENEELRKMFGVFKDCLKENPFEYATCSDKAKKEDDIQVWYAHVNKLQTDDRANGIQQHLIPVLTSEEITMLQEELSQLMRISIRFE